MNDDSVNDRSVFLDGIPMPFYLVDVKRKIQKFLAKTKVDPAGPSLTHLFSE
jgi:hypothetical protein